MEQPTPQNVFLIIQGGPYGTERAYNSLSLAMQLVKQAGVSVRVFLTGDGVLCARGEQKTPTVTTTSSA